MREIRIGDLVRFMEVDYGIDIEPPIGYLEPVLGVNTTLSRAWNRAKASFNSDSILADKFDVGLVVDCETRSTLHTIWFKVLIKGSCFWFDGQHLIPVDND